MKKFVVSMVFLIFGLLFVVNVPANAQLVFWEDMWAGQSISAGYIFIWQEENGLKVIISPFSPWKISESHVEIVLDPANFPITNSGNPKPGNFTWSQSTTPISNHEYKIPYSGICGGLIAGQSYRIYVAVHSVFWNGLEEETAWGGPCDRSWSPGQTLPEEFYKFGGNRWGYYFYIDVTIPNPMIE